MTASAAAPRAQEIRRGQLFVRVARAPWDDEAAGGPAAVISGLRLDASADAGALLAEYDSWIARERIVLCCARPLQGDVAGMALLEDRGFRFIELNYRPELAGIQARAASADGVETRAALPGERAALVEAAGQVFRHGRFHQDPAFGPAVGDRRYRRWLDGAFARADQEVVVCAEAGRIVAFFVVERPRSDARFWSLVALIPGLAGRGLGKRAVAAMLERHRREGAEAVSTSISSHNLAAFNLYARLGFRFPEPAVTLHWRRAAPRTEN